MKYCPQCQTTYTDDLLKYCLKDGTPLGNVFDSPIRGAAFGTAENTPSIRRVEPIDVQQARQNEQAAHTAPVQTAPAASYSQSNQAPLNAMQPEARQRKTGSIVAMTILGTLLLLALGGLAAMYYFKNQKTEAVANVNKTPVNRAANANAANVQTTNLNSNRQTISANANLAAPSPTATPKTAVNPQSAEAVADQVEAAIDDWKNATENLDIGGQMNQYAETVDYYRSGRVDRRAVRADKDRAFGIYERVNINISNLKITPGESGENATALFDKEWDFEGAAAASSGKVQQQLTLSKIGGRWLITGERDLRVYYQN